MGVGFDDDDADAPVVDQLLTWCATDLLLGIDVVRDRRRAIDFALNVDMLCAVLLLTVLLACWILTFNHAALFFCGFHGNDAAAAVVFVADPQMDGLARVEREGMYGWFNNVLNDHMLRIALNSILRSVGASARLVVALGDLFYSQHLSDAHFDHILHRYRHVVSQTVESFQLPLLNVSGNHDIGYGAELRAGSHVVQRFVQHFGALNLVHVVANHLFVVVNSLALDGASDRALYDAAWAHVDAAAAAAAEHSMPVILLVHIPLYKPSYSCPGDVIEQSSYAADMDGAWYQTVLSANTTLLLLERLRPVLVFSGHDHEGCVYRHNNETVEHTVRAAQGFYETNLAVLSIGRNQNDGSYRYELVNCPFWHTNYYCVLLALTALSLAGAFVIATKRIVIDHDNSNGNVRAVGRDRSKSKSPRRRQR